MLTLVAALLVAAPFDLDAQAKAFRADLESFVKADTTNPPGNEERIVKLVAARLKKEGIPYTVQTFAPGRQNIIARLKGTGAAKPLLLLAHIDVVGTANQAWSTDPHTVVEKDGYLYGRGVMDDLASATLNLETFIALKRKGVKLRRDVILALTGDEESGGAGAIYLLEHDPSMKELGLVLNEGGGLVRDVPGGKARFASLEVAQKTYQDFILTATGKTGHSSLPQKDNAINRLADALARLAKHEPEARLTPATRAFFKERAAFEDAETAKAMNAVAAAKDKLPRDAVQVLDKNLLFSALLRTTCVTTMVDGGTKANALPPKASANVNCRILPDETVAQTEARLKTIISDPRVEVTRAPEFGGNIPSSLEGEFPTALKELLAENHPGVPIIPAVMTGATDSRVFRQLGDGEVLGCRFGIVEGDEARCHGIDERIEIESIRPALELNMKMLQKLAAVAPDS
jgi:acetylornithine deacetylase/succinyl-diaminopimelate desuccinylase-like protein